jgi:hypothetical protein
MFTTEAQRHGGKIESKANAEPTEGAEVTEAFGSRVK